MGNSKGVFCMVSVTENRVAGDKVTAAAKAAIEAGEGIVRLGPAWVPRVFMQPGRRLKLHPADYYALGTDRGGINERWFGSTVNADNPGAAPDEGLAYIVHDGARFTLKDAVAAVGADLVGDELWNKYKRWPVYSKFFDNMGAIPFHHHQSNEDAALVGQEGKPESYYFPPQHNVINDNFPYTFFGFEPGTTKADVVRCLELWNAGDNRITDFSKAYRLKPGTGWLVGAGILHAPGSFVTYEPQWGSDVFGMFESMVEGRAVDRQFLTKDVPADKHNDLEYMVEQLDWEANIDPNFKASRYLEPIVDEACSGDGYTDRWVVYGKFDGKELFSAKELTVEPGATAFVKDGGATSIYVSQGHGRIGGFEVDCPVMIRFGEMTEDEVFITAKRAGEGYEVENKSGACPLVLLRYFGPDVNPQAPNAGDHLKLNQ
jgi:hypothetical protein